MNTNVDRYTNFHSMESVQLSMENEKKRKNLIGKDELIEKFINPFIIAIKQ